MRATASAPAPGRTPRATAIAQNVDDLHSANNKISKQTALNEKGEMVNGRGDTPNRHDVLTGSQPDGRAFTAGDDRTCGNWTKSGAGAAMVGHHDRQGLRDDDAVEVLEFVASLARSGRRLQPSRFAEHRRRRPVLLFRHQLTDNGDTDSGESSPLSHRPTAGCGPPWRAGGRPPA